MDIKCLEFSKYNLTYLRELGCFEICTRPVLPCDEYSEQNSRVINKRAS